MIDHSRSTHEADLMQHAKEGRVNDYSLRNIIRMVRGDNHNGRRIPIRIIITSMGVAKNHVAAESQTALRNDSRDTQTGTAASPVGSSPARFGFH
jgi:hypothetical protein